MAINFVDKNGLQSLVNKIKNDFVLKTKIGGSELGLVKSATTGTTSNRNYNVQINSDGTMKVNVPWVTYSQQLTNQDLNSIKSEGFYSAGGGNTVSNKPTGVEHFGMYVVHRASGDFWTQILINGDGSKQYRRHTNNGTWGAWVEDKLTE